MGLFFWASALISIPGILGVFGVYLLLKGLIFTGFGLNAFNLIDIAIEFAMIGTSLMIIPPILISVMAIYLIGKGSFSFFKII